MKQNIGVQGKYNVKISRLTSDNIQKYREILDLIDGGVDYSRQLVEFLSLSKSREYTFNNIIPLVGRRMIANNIASSSPDNVLAATHVALGTGTDSTTDSDVLLDTEVYRKAIASRTNADDSAYISGFFSATDCVGTYHEAGIFCDATDTTGSGILLSRVILNDPTGIVKTNIETLTLDWEITISY